MRTEQTGGRGQAAWSGIHPAATEAAVKRLQGRIYRAAAAGKGLQVKSLRKLLVRSTSAKRLAVRRVTQQNAGRSTPGVDGVVCRTPEGRTRLVTDLDLRSHRPLPVRRVRIPKSDGGRRPLGIPTIRDRAMQMLVKLALEPEWEPRFEANSYGFRPGRCTMDAIVALHATPAPAGASACMLDADISGCFDHASCCPPQEPASGVKASRSTAPARSFCSPFRVLGASGNRYSPEGRSRATAIAPMWMRS